METEKNRINSSNCGGLGRSIYMDPISTRGVNGWKGFTRHSRPGDFGEVKTNYKALDQE